MTESRHTRWRWNLMPVDMVQPLVTVSGSPDGPFRAASPDPLHAYIWPEVSRGFEYYSLAPVEARWSRHQSPNWPERPSDSRVLQPGEILDVPCVVEVDFGVEVPGWLEIDDPGPGVSVRLGVSEHRSPSLVNIEAVAPSKTAAPRRHGGVLRLELTDEIYEGVRFGYVFVDALDSPIEVPKIRLIVRAKPITYRGSFEGPRPLEEVWYSSAATLRHTMQEHGIGSILRERGDRYAWAGDTYPTVASSLYAFGDVDNVIESLEELCGDAQGIPTYELYWVLSVAKLATLRGLPPRIVALLDECVATVTRWWSTVDDDRHYFFVGWDERLGAGLEHPDSPEGRGLALALLVQATIALDAVLRAANRPSAAISSLAADAPSRLAEGADWPNLGLHARSEAVLAGLTGIDLGRACSESQLSLSPFSQWPIVRALTRIGDAETALCAVDGVWGGMLRFGASTTMEAFRPAWATATQQPGAVPTIAGGTVSFCHPWGAGVLSWLVEDYAGIVLDSLDGVSVSARGSGSLDGSPYAIDLPTPLGVAHIAYEPGAGVTIDAPPGVTSFITSESIPLTTAHDRHRHDAFATRLERVPPIESERLGTIGSVHFGVDDTLQLPSGWSVTLANGFETLPLRRDAAVPTFDSRAPHGVDRMGFISTESLAWPRFTMTVDIGSPLSTETTRATLYLVDGDRVGQRFAVDLFDLATGQQLARTLSVGSTEEGAWVQWEMDRPVRLRLADIAHRGASAVALFLDPC